jgi:FHS family L-fucose permease-like MFS transporter
MHPVDYLYIMQFTNSKITRALPVFMAYIVMGFVDIVGVSTGYIKKDFELTERVAQLITSMALVWFFFLCVPTGLLLEKFGKRIILNVGMFITGLGMLIPFLHYSFPVMLVAFIFLGIGNTIVQVSANPLLHDVVPAEKYTSYMSLSQFIKAICSLLGPIIATFMAVKAGNWKLVYFVYATVSFLTVLWLYLTNISEAKMDKSPATFRSCFSLLGDRFILLMVMAIAGGAFLPPVMGLVSTLYGVLSSFFVLVIAMLYILVISVYAVKARNDITN